MRRSEWRRFDTRGEHCLLVVRGRMPTRLDATVKLVPMFREHAADVVTWRYPAPYECYDMTDADPEFLADPDNNFFALLDDERLIGFRSFGVDGQRRRWTPGEGFVRNWSVTESGTKRSGPAWSTAAACSLRRDSASRSRPSTSVRCMSSIVSASAGSPGSGPPPMVFPTTSSSGASATRALRSSGQISGWCSTSRPRPH
jgi:hypothetical protein